MFGESWQAKARSGDSIIQPTTITGPFTFYLHQTRVVKQAGCLVYIIYLKSFNDDIAF